MFVENESLNFNEVLKNCGVDVDPPSVVLMRFFGLEEFYSAEELSELYNYALLNIKNYELMSGIIKLADSHKSDSTLAVLLDILLMRAIQRDDSDEQINLRALCAKAISNYKSPSTMGALLYCLNNKEENYKIRLACADALGRIGDRYAVAPLIDVVKDEDEKSVYVKESAAFALGLIGDSSAIDPLVAIMEAKQGIWDKFSF